MFEPARDCEVHSISREVKKSPSGPRNRGEVNKVWEGFAIGGVYRISLLPPGCTNRANLRNNDSLKPQSRTE